MLLTEDDEKTSRMRMARYALVGIASNFLGYLLYLFLTFIQLEPKVAMTGLYLLGTMAGFLGNRVWTFSYQGAMGASFLRYVLAYLAGYVLNLSTLVVFVDRLGMPHQVVQAAAIGAVALCLYLLLRCFVFSDNARETREGA